MSALDLRYTDQDVRENDELTDAAVEYVENYTGEFRYLIEMKQRLETGMSLTTGMVRGVLNCMRCDPRVQGLPAPKGYTDNVVKVSFGELPQRKRQRRRYAGRVDCPQVADQVEHNYHQWETPEDQDATCNGWHAINREECFTTPTIKVPFVLANGGKMIHLVGDPTRHSIYWPARGRHQWGFSDYISLRIKTACKYPSFISSSLYRLPRLLTFDDAVSVRNTCEVQFCKHCAEVMRDYT